MQQTVKLYKISIFSTLSIILQNWFKTFQGPLGHNIVIIYCVKTHGNPIYLLCYSTLVESFMITARFPSESPRDSRRRLRLLFNGSFMWVLSWEWKKITIENKLLKLNYNIINLFKFLSSLSDMVNSWWKRDPSPRPRNNGLISYFQKKVLYCINNIGKLIQTIPRATINVHKLVCENLR